MFALDQATKALVLAQLRDRQAIVLGRVAIRGLINRRVVGGFLSGPRQLLVLWIAEVLVIAGLIHFGPFPTATTATGGRRGARRSRR